MPAKLGDLYRAYLLKGNYGASVSRTVGTIFIERIADIIVIFALALAAGFWSFRGRSMPGGRRRSSSSASSSRSSSSCCVGRAPLLRPAHRRASCRCGSRELWRALPRGEHRRADAAQRCRSSASLTVVIWLLEGARLYFVIHALGLPEVDLGISASVFVALAAALLTAMPLTPAGVGFVEAGIVGALLIYGVSPEHAAAVALTDRAISILSVIILGGILYAVQRQGAPRPRRRDRASPVGLGDPRRIERPRAAGLFREVPSSY